MAGAKVDPLRHFLRRGATEGRAPNPLFDPAYYAEQRPDLATEELLWHYISDGASEGLDPHPLFDTTYYIDHNPDVAWSSANPLGHYLKYGGAEGRDPHPDFDSSFYLQTNADVAAAGVNPLVHYLSSGALEGRDPNPHFDSSYYLETFADVRTRGLNPLVHYVRFGRDEGRSVRDRRPSRAKGYTPPQGLLPWFNPLAATITESRTRLPTLNILLPRVGTASLSGGPNTALVLGCKLAAAGVRVRFVSADLALDTDLGPLRDHLRTLHGAELPPLEFYRRPRSHRCRRIRAARRLPGNGLVDRAAGQVRRPADQAPPLHLPDPGLRAAPARRVDAIRPRARNLLARPRTADQQHAPPRLPRGAAHRPLRRSRVRASRAGLPARARPHALPSAAGAGGEVTPTAALFYARPQYGLRNLFELGACALQKAVKDKVLDADEWEFWGMGEAFHPIGLGAGATLVPAPWRDLAGYAEQMRESDILLSLMLSPHPSYPPLEMAASAGLVVTTTFANKSASALAAMSPNIIGVAATIEDVAAGLAAAAARLDDWPARLRGAAIDLPGTWAESFDAILPGLLDELALLQGPARPASARGPAARGPVSPAVPRLAAGCLRRLSPRRLRAAPPRISGPRRARSRQLPDHRPGHPGGACRGARREPAHAGMRRQLRVDPPRQRLRPGRRRAPPSTGSPPIRASSWRGSRANLGIVGGMRACLERATGRYIAPLDPDDLLAPDTVRVVTHALRAAGYPPLAYTDEDTARRHALLAALSQAGFRSGALLDLLLCRPPRLHSTASWR